MIWKMLCEENMANRSSEFWGICCEGGKKYSQVVRQKFHMTMAALDPTVIPTSPVVSLMVDRGGCEYLLCSLKPGTLLQVNLNLYFDKGEKVTFSLIGKGKIHLSGYHIYDKNDSVPAATEKKASTSPLKTNKTGKGGLAIAVESDDSSDVQEILKKDDKMGQTVSPKKNLDKKDKKVKKPKDDESNEDSDDDDLLNELEDEDSSEDEGAEDNKKDSNRLQSYKRLWSSLTQSEEEEEESDSDDSDEDSEEDTSKKNDKQFQNKKRPKNENSETNLDKKSGKNTPKKSIDVDNGKLMKKTPKQDLLNSSIGRTPMPQKKILKDSLTNSSKAITPKKVIFADVESSDSENEKDPSSLNMTPSKAVQPTTPSSETKKKRKKKKKNQSPDVSNSTNESPAKPKGLSSSSFNQKLPGGLEYEDIRVGNGPIAKKGRLVHVYYTGMLENNKVFDSREIGNKPFSFKLGSNQVIKGWDMAVEGMKVGGKRRMKIPPGLGYANARTGPIPPNSTLYFTVELKAVS